jgi:DNA-binding MarR family transcriptional regulator
MTDQEKKMQVLVEQFLRIINKYNALQKKPYDFGIGERLHPAEIHTVSAIAGAGTVNVTELAGKLGVTKGAVSQMVSRLEKKGLVRKSRDRANDKEVLLDLTRRGKKAHEGHARFHGGMYGEFTAMMESMSPEQAMLFGDVLGRIEFYFDRYGEDHA